MLSQIIVNLYAVLLEISLWIILVAGAIGGWNAGRFLGAIGGMVIAAVFGASFFGALLVLNDIRNMVKKIADRQ